MADVNLTLGVQLDSQSLANIAKEIELIKKSLEGLKVGPGGGGGGGGGGGVPKEYKEFAEALALIKTRMRDAETEFRKVAIAQRENKGSTDELNKAKEAAIRTFQAEANALDDLKVKYANYPVLLDKVSVTQKSLVEGQQRVNVGFVGMATALKDVDTSIKASNNVLLEFGRGVSDAGMFALDFRMGMIAVANNVSQTADSFGRLWVQSKDIAKEMRDAGQSATTLGVAMSNLGKSMMGVNGVIFLFNLALTAIQLWPKETDKAVDATLRISDAARILGNEFERVSRAITSSKEKAGLIVGDTAATQDQIKRLADALSKLNAEQTKLFQTTGLKSDGKSSMSAENADAIAKNMRLIEVLRAQKEELELRLEAQRRINGLVGEEVGNQDKLLKGLDKLRQFRAEDLRQLQVRAMAESPLEDDEVKVPGVDIDLRSPFGTNPERERRNQEALKRVIIAGQLEIANAQNKAFSDRRAAAELAESVELQSLVQSESFKTMTTWEQEEARHQIRKKYKDLNAQIDRDQMQSINSLISLSATALNAFADMADQRSKQLASEGKTQEAKAAFERAKKLSIAQALAYTYLSANAAMAQTPGGPVAQGIAAALAITAGLINVQRIRNTKFDDGNYNGGSNNRFGTTREGFNFVNNGESLGGTTARNTSGFASAKLTPTIVINSQLSQDVLAYNVREGEAIIRQQSTLMKSDAA